MGIPQVPEPVRRAPTLALRAVFAGIGRILMSADRPEAGHRPEAEGRQETGSAAAAVAPAQPGSRWRSLDQTGNVRLLTAEAAGTPALPVAGYDSLSLASIRARLRGLDVGQLKILLDYEAANAERPDVLGMFERRIEKLESGW
jgi:hypothetical protein